jgi:hypothetical protein
LFLLVAFAVEKVRNVVAAFSKGAAIQRNAIGVAMQLFGEMNFHAVPFG